MKKFKKGIKWILAVALVMLIVTGTEDVPKAYAAKAADLTVEIDTGVTIILKDTDGAGAYEIGKADDCMLSQRRLMQVTPLSMVS